MTDRDTFYINHPIISNQENRGRVQKICLLVESNRNRVDDDEIIRSYCCSRADVAVEIIHSQNTCDISTLETYYLNFISSQLYTKKWLQCSESVYLRSGDTE